MPHLFPICLSDTHNMWCHTSGRDICPQAATEEQSMAKRYKMPNGQSRRDFTRKARTHGKNLLGTPMRGGIRL